MSKSSNEGKPLPDSFYLQGDVVNAARSLLGMHLISNINGQTTSGIITETEAYCHVNDKACHAYKKITPRNEAMFGPGGYLYTYLCYGIHTLINVVTNVKGKADAILIRAILPVMGLHTIADRRHSTIPESQLNSPYQSLAYFASLTNGPGKVSQALGITRQENKTKLGDQVMIEDIGLTCKEKDFDRLKRVGIDYAEESADLPWRFLANKSWCESVSSSSKVSPLINP